MGVKHTDQGQQNQKGNDGDWDRNFYFLVIAW
jgi:hypothetical protein